MTYEQKLVAGTVGKIEGMSRATDEAIRATALDPAPSHPVQACTCGSPHLAPSMHAAECPYKKSLAPDLVTEVRVAHSHPDSPSNPIPYQVWFDPTLPKGMARRWSGSEWVLTQATPAPVPTAEQLKETIEKYSRAAFEKGMFQAERGGERQSPFGIAELSLEFYKGYDEAEAQKRANRGRFWLFVKTAARDLTSRHVDPFVQATRDRLRNVKRVP